MKRFTVLLAALGVLIASACADIAPLPGAEAARGERIGFIFVGARDDLGYNQAAWEGSEAVARAFPDLVVLRREHVPEKPPEVAERVMEDMVRHGARILFATSLGHLDAAVAVARRHPDVIVLHAGGRVPSPPPPNLGTFFGTVYEPVYLAGIAAGAATKTGTLGFVAALPVPSVFANVNAFTLGARSVSPSAVTRVIFTGSWCDPPAQKEAATSLLAAGADVITQHQDCTRTVLETAEAAGALSVGYHYDGSEVAPRGWLVGSVWDWRALFIDMVRTILMGRFATSRYHGDFRGSLRDGDNPFLLTELGPAADPRTAPLIAAARARFRAGSSPFEGPLSDRDGVSRVAPGVVPSPSEIDSMSYLVPGVIGDLPR